MKKILLILLLLVIAGVGTLFVINGKDSYDPSKYSATLSDGLKVGSTVSYTLPDQFDKSYTLDDSIHTLIVVFAKESGHSVKNFLKEQPANYLSQHKAAFIADVSPMPVVIRNTFALPDLKKESYSVKLIYDKKIADAFKKYAQSSEDILLVTLKNKKITGIKYVKTAQEIKETLK